MTNKLVVIKNSLKVRKIKKILLYDMKFIVPNYSCLQNPTSGLPPPDTRSLCPLSSTEFVEPPPTPNKIPGYATAQEPCILPTQCIFEFCMMVTMVTYTKKQYTNGSYNGGGLCCLWGTHQILKHHSGKSQVSKTVSLLRQLPLTTDAQVQCQAAPREMCHGQSHTRTGFSPHTQIFPCQ